MAEEKPILFSVDGGVARITLNRPDKRNALNQALISDLKEAFHSANGNSAVRVILLTGAGPDFCSGADLSELERISAANITENVLDAQRLVDLFTLIRQVRVPVVAAVRGRALAGGCGLATACDIVLATSSARFGYPEVRVGFVPAIVMAILRRSVAEKIAFELITRGEEIEARRAQEIGLINRAFTDEAFEEEVESFVRYFEKISQSAIALGKRLLYQIDGMSLPEALSTGADVNVITRMTNDCQEGITRFLAKGTRPLNPEN